MKDLPPEYSAGIWLSMALAFVGGYTDAATYVVSTVFAGHISGNLVLAAISMVSMQWRQAALRAGAVLTMVIAIGATSVLDTGPVRRTKIRGTRVPPLTLALFLEAAFFLVPGGFLLAHHPLPTEVNVLLLSVGLGLQTGALRRTNGASVYTAFMAGMVTRLAEGETEKLEGRRDSTLDDSLANNDAGTLAKLAGAFTVGACAGSGMALHANRFAVVAAGLVLLLLAVGHTVRATTGSGAPA